MTTNKKEKKPLKFGWILYILEDKKGVYHTGMTRSLKRTLLNINVLNYGHASKYPERLPVEVVFEERNVPFKEAHAKFKYLRKMNRYLRNKLIRTKIWPLGGDWKEFVLKEN